MLEPAYPRHAPLDTEAETRVQVATVQAMVKRVPMRRLGEAYEKLKRYDESPAISSRNCR